jgi:hypothetical protein
MTVLREAGGVTFSDGYSVMETVWVVIQRDPDRFKFFLDMEEAKAEKKRTSGGGSELWSRTMYEAMDGSIMNWSNFTQDKRKKL